MKLKIELCFSAFIILLFAFPDTARACLCGKVKPCEAYAKASVVFAGSVVDVSMKPAESAPVGDVISYTLTSERPVALIKVEEAFLGVKTKEVEVSGVGINCDYDFDVGQRYLVYASRGSDGKLYTSLCSRTAPLSEASEDLAYLRNVTKSLRGGTVSGEVVRAVYRMGADAPTTEPIPKAKVIFNSGGRRFQTHADDKGRFEMRRLPAGRYRVRTDPATNASYADVMTEEPRNEWEINVPDHGCVPMWFSLRPSGEVTGYIIDNEERIVKDAEVSILSLDWKVENEFFLFDDKTNAEGQFKFTFLPPGRYLLGFNIHGGPFRELPYPEFYYPGVVERARATIITLKENQKVSGLKLQRPPPAGASD